MHVDVKVEVFPRPDHPQCSVYRFARGDHTVELWEVIGQGLFDVWDKCAPLGSPPDTIPVDGEVHLTADLNFLPLCTAQLLALKTLGVE